MEKVKITKEQAEAIEEYKESETGIYDFLHDLPLDYMTNRSWDNVEENQQEMLKVMTAFVTGDYEVEPEFNDDEWVVLKDGKVVEVYYVKNRSDLGSIGNIVGIPKDKVFAYDLGGDYWYDYNDIDRHATPEEIAEEKERRWWREHGRKVKEVRNGDIIYSYYTGITLVKDENNRHVTNFNGFRVICFAEDRLDVKK